MKRALHKPIFINLKYCVSVSKYTRGQATAYISRNSALKKLQLSLADFRRLCILKGIFPVQPKDPKKANKGVKSTKSFYLVKDIRLLGHEPVLNKFRQLKVFSRRLRRARGRRDLLSAKIIQENFPIVTLDHIILERYPQFTDAINDLDDCLCLVLLFASFPINRDTPSDVIAISRQLYFEFLHYVALTRSLRKCFISIKGFYLQAEICGQCVTWVMPHQICHQPSDDVDFRIMRTFLDFYIQMLGFVNYKLFTDQNRQYPPELKAAIWQAMQISTKRFLSQQRLHVQLAFQMLASLAFCPEGNEPLRENDDDMRFDDPLTNDLIEQETDQIKKVTTARNLFDNLKFFLNREVPREVFAFVIRCFGGQVSWDANVACGSTFTEADTSITYQVVDRPLTDKMRLFPNRMYVQPQWVFDSINNGILMPIEDYIPGASVPAHRSPFVRDEHVLPEQENGPTRPIDIRLMPSKLDTMPAEERKLREMTIPRKLKRIYHKAVHSRKVKRKQVQKLTDVKRRIENEGKQRNEQAS